MRIKNLPSIESMDGSQDALIIEQTDGSEDKSRKVSPAQIKQYVLNDMDDVPTADSNNPVKSGGIFSTMAVPKYDSANRREYYEGGGAFGGNIDSSPTAGSNNAVASGGVKTYVDNADAALNTAIGERVKIAAVSGTINCTTADSTAIGGHKTGGAEAKALSSFTGYPTGKTVVGWSLSACGAVANVLAVVHVAAGYVYVNAAYSGTFTVNGFVFYKD